MCRGAPVRTRGGNSWRPAETVPATLPVWTGPTAWLEQLTAALHTPEAEVHRRRLRPSLETVLDVAAIDARTADVDTGRGVATAHETVANELGCSPKTVYRSRTLIETIGYATTVEMGRYLTADERAEANAAHGGDQKRMASTRALTTPRPTGEVTQHSQPPAAAAAASAPGPRAAGHPHTNEPTPEAPASTTPSATSGGDSEDQTPEPVASPDPAPAPSSTTNVRLPPCGAVIFRPSHSGGLPTRARARVGAPTPAKNPPKQQPTRERPTLAVQRLAAGLATRLPWLARGHIGTLCAALTSLGIDADGWAASDVIALLDDYHTTRSLYSVPPSNQRHPIGLFVTQMRAALADVTETPHHRRARQAAERAAERARRLAERAEAAARCAAIATDPGAQTRIAAAKTDIRATLGRTHQHNKHRRYAPAEPTPNAGRER